jgi:hypothetical protein
MPLQVAVNIEELKLALESSQEMATAYLDTQTGLVVYIESNELDAYDLPLDDGREAVAAAIDADEDIYSQNKSELMLQYDLFYGADHAKRFRVIPSIPSRWAYQDMEEFCESVENDELRGKLDVALDGRGAFRRFKNVLDDYPKARQRWFAFKDSKMEHRAREWLSEQDIELVED